MKHTIKHILLLIIPILMIGVMITSCQDDEAPNGGKPVIYYVRGTNPDVSDSLYAGAFLGNVVAIVGDNLQDAREIWFNDQEGDLIPTYVTSTTIITFVPSDAPLERNNKLKLIFANGEELLYDFTVEIPPPLISSMDCEFVDDGETAAINGNYFFDVTPVTVSFTGPSGQLPAEIVSLTPTRIEVEVPDGAVSGPVTVKTNFGETVSSLHFRDNRNIFLNYDEPGKTPIGSWRTGVIVEDENSLDGKYLKFKGVYAASGDRNEGDSPNSLFESQFWAQTSGRPESNLLPGDPINYVMKFEVKVVTWYASYLNICFAPWDHKDSNGEIWGNGNARAIWGPWDEKDAEYSTNGEWMTVTIPMTEFKWAMNKPATDVEYTEMKFDKSKTGSLSFWVLSAPKASDSPFEFYIDNVRIVEK